MHLSNKKHGSPRIVYALWSSEIIQLDIANTVINHWEQTWLMVPPQAIKVCSLLENLINWLIPVIDNSTQWDLNQHSASLALSERPFGERGTWSWRMDLLSSILYEHYGANYISPTKFYMLPLYQSPITSHGSRSTNFHTGQDASLEVSPERTW